MVTGKLLDIAVGFGVWAPRTRRYRRLCCLRSVEEWGKLV